MPIPLSATAKLPEVAVAARRHAHARRLVAAELDRVADQVLEHEPEQRRARRTTSAGGPSTSTSAPVSSMAGPSVAVRLGDELVAVDELAAARSMRPTRENASRSLIRSCMRFAPSTAKPMYWSARSSSWPRVAALEQLAEARDLAQRLLEVVRGDVGELLELGVGALQRERLGVDLRLGRAQDLELARRSARASPRRRCRARDVARAAGRGSCGRSAPPATARTCVGEPRDRPRDDLAARSRRRRPPRPAAARPRSTRAA